VDLALVDGVVPFEVVRHLQQYGNQQEIHDEWKNSGTYDYEQIVFHVFSLCRQFMAIYSPCQRGLPGKGSRGSVVTGA
jgi:hypothetical protein